jgi:hypothetical protein
MGSIPGGLLCTVYEFDYIDYRKTCNPAFDFFDDDEKASFNSSISHTQRLRLCLLQIPLATRLEEEVFSVAASAKSTNFSDFLSLVIALASFSFATLCAPFLAVRKNLYP